MVSRLSNNIYNYLNRNSITLLSIIDFPCGHCENETIITFSLDIRCYVLDTSKRLMSTLCTIIGRIRQLLLSTNISNLQRISEERFRKRKTHFLEEKEIYRIHFVPRQTHTVHPSNIIRAICCKRKKK